MLKSDFFTIDELEGLHISNLGVCSDIRNKYKLKHNHTIISPIHNMIYLSPIVIELDHRMKIMKAIDILRNYPDHQEPAVPPQRKSKISIEVPSNAIFDDFPELAPLFRYNEEFLKISREKLYSERGYPLNLQGIA